MTAAVRQASGWWPALVQVVCDSCGYVGPVRDMNASPSAHRAVRAEAQGHVCGQEGEL